MMMLKNRWKLSTKYTGAYIGEAKEVTYIHLHIPSCFITITNKLHTDTISTTITTILLFYDPTELKYSTCIAQVNKTGVFLCITTSCRTDE